MIRVHVDSIRFSLLTQQRIVVLREVNTRRYITIWIGMFEAEAIAMAMQGQEPPRPMTHDLLLNAIVALGGSLREIVVNDFHDSTFFARLHIDLHGRTIELDSRSSDAIALAVRASCPIYVANHVMDELGHMMDEQDESEDIPTTSVSQSEPEAAQTADDEELSIFRKFIDSIDNDEK